MKLTVKQSDLAAVLTAAGSVVERKSTMPILAMALLEADTDSLAVTATDLELTYRRRIPAKVRKSGKACAPAKRLTEIAKAFDDSEIRLELGENHRLEVRCERSRFNLAGMATDNFPAFGWDAEAKFTAVKVEAAELRTLLSRLAFAVCAEESRYTLNGIYLGEGEGVATDGHRLALVPAAWAKDLGPVLIPKKAVGALLSLLRDGPVTVHANESHILFIGEGWKLLSRKLAGQFPNHKAVIPAEDSLTLRVRADAEALTASVNRAALLADARTPVAKLSLIPGEPLVIESSSAEYGEAREEVAVQVEGQEPLTIGFNANYLADYLSKLKGEVEFAAATPDKSARFSQDGYVYVVMPMRF